MDLGAKDRGRLSPHRQGKDEDLVDYQEEGQPQLISFEQKPASLIWDELECLQFSVGSP